MGKIPVVAILGPTACGKTDLSIKIAKKFFGEIISADSMQIYREFKICTAKPDENQMSQVKHYMIDEISVEEDFSVADYIKKAHFFAERIIEKGKIPIVVGGTGLYLDSFLGNLSLEEKKFDTCIREKLNDRAKSDKEGLFKDLMDVDKESAEKIHPNDIKRVVRALEFYYSFGYPISLQVKRSKENESPYNTTFIGINFLDRNLLHKAIEDRVDNMVEKGLIDEVSYVSHLNVSKTASACIGYKEILPYLEQKCSLDEAVLDLKKETKAYAKRQITWFKRNENVNWIYKDEVGSNLVQEAFKILKENGFDEAI